MGHTYPPRSLLPRQAPTSLASTVSQTCCTTPSDADAHGIYLSGPHDEYEPKDFLTFYTPRRATHHLPPAAAPHLARLNTAPYGLLFRTTQPDAAFNSPAPPPPTPCCCVAFDGYCATRKHLPLQTHSWRGYIPPSLAHVGAAHHCWRRPTLPLTLRHSLVTVPLNTVFV